MLKVKIDGMTCGHCERAVKSALAKVAGVTKIADFSLARGEAVLEGAPDVAAVIAAVKDAGYEARPLP
jgi:copper chaperone